MEQVKNIIATIVLAILAYLEPIEGELKTLLLVFFLNFFFGYLSDMVNGADFSLKKALVCIGHAAVFFVLCASVYVIGKAKGQMAGAVQCVSFITYLVMYFYSLNILRNLKKTFKEKTPPYHVVSALYFLLRFKFVEKIPFLSEYLNKEKEKEKLTEEETKK